MSFLAACGLVLGVASAPPSGQAFRTVFDPGSRWLIGGGLAGTADGGLEAIAETAVLYRHLLDFPEEHVAWKLEHRLLSGRVSPGGAVEVTLYEGGYHRWMRDGWITVPTSPPKRLPFPLNIGAEGVAGRFRTRPDDPDLLGELAVQHAQVVFDFWRSRRLGSYAGIGFGPSYDILFYADRRVHRIAPFTRATMRVHHEFEEGRQALDLRGEAAYAWSADDVWIPSGEARAGYELIVLALNDWPLSVFAEVSYRFDRTHQLRGTAGLRFAAPLTE